MKCGKARQLVEFGAESDENREAISGKRDKIRRHLERCPKCVEWLERKRAAALKEAFAASAEHDGKIEARIGAVLDQIKAFARDLEQEMHQGEPCAGCRTKVVVAVGQALGLQVMMVAPMRETEDV